MTITRRSALASLLSVTLVGALVGACGRTDETANASSSGEIVVGGSFPMSGPYAPISAVSKGAAAYFAKVNAEGGINGRKIKYEAYDDGYDPGRAAANIRRGVDQDKAQAFLTFGVPGEVVRPYLNQNKVFNVAYSGSTQMSQVDQFPYSHAWWPDLTAETGVIAQYVGKEFPAAKVGVLTLNNDLADAAAAGFKAGGVTPAVSLKVPPSQQDNTAQVAQLKAAGVDVLYLALGAPQMVPTLKYMAQIGYRPKTFVYSITINHTSLLDPLTPAISKGLNAALWLDDPADPRWANDPGIQAYKKDIATYGEGASADDMLALNGFAGAAALVSAMKAAKTQDADGYNTAWNALKDVPAPGLIGGTLNAGPGGRLVYRYQVVEFDGSSWQNRGPVQDAVQSGLIK
ncbi:MAG TPA: ABC transporter substrate-binding protein [Amycolatopsis sp.]|uniref:ABC transporter substrate-binding protein n=1 Tax=Amycolatopsis sp. TaxID=37632 RepID=UPI002B486618|nr:ABC transporter substrate-binding protein [Amycolatopsis sp.]HKS47482.1 ABC transporter substrate-binding protein [Amycolatopsis sp.]